MPVKRKQRKLKELLSVVLCDITCMTTSQMPSEILWNNDITSTHINDAIKFDRELYKTTYVCVLHTCY